jgi:hypothetical protein
MIYIGLGSEHKPFCDDLVYLWPLDLDHVECDLGPQLYDACS